MSNTQVQAILDTALVSGSCEVVVQTSQQADLLRRLLYNARARHRKKGNTAYDELYFRILEDPDRISITSGFPFQLRIVAKAEAGDV